MNQIRIAVYNYAKKNKVENRITRLRKINDDKTQTNQDNNKNKTQKSENAEMKMKA